MPTNDTTYTVTVATSGATAATAPTTADQGISLSGRKGFRVLLSAISGQTITSGSLYVYYYHSVLQRWFRNDDLEITIGTAGVRDLTFPDYGANVPWGGVYVTPHNVTISGGSNVLVRIDTY